MFSTTITIGTTKAKILDLIKDTASYSGASVSQKFEGLLNGNGVQRLIIQAHPDNSGRIYVGDGGVSATNCGLILEGGSSDQKESGHGFNDIPFNFWILGSAASQKLLVNFEYA